MKIMDLIVNVTLIAIGVCEWFRGDTNGLAITAFVLASTAVMNQ